MTMPDVSKSSDFEKWLRSVCFKAPPEHCYDLAKSAWEASQSKVDELLEKQREYSLEITLREIRHLLTNDEAMELSKFIRNRRIRHDYFETAKIGDSDE